MNSKKSQFNQKINDIVIKRAQKGNLEAQEEIYKTFAQVVFNLAMGITRNQQEAEDILQNTFVSVLKKVKSFKFKAPFGMWLRQVVVNQTLMQLREKSTKELNQDSSYENIVDIDSVKASDQVENHHQLDHVMDLNTLLAQLTRQSRTVLLLKEVEGYSHKEISEMMGKSESYSKAVVSRAYEQLRQKTIIQDLSAATGER